MKKVFFSLFFIMLLAIPAHASFYVEQVSAEVAVQENGKAKVTERIQLTFDETESQVVVPLPEGNISRISGEGFHYKVEKTEEGVNVVFSTKGGFSGTQSFTVSYHMAAPASATESEIDYSVGILSARWPVNVGVCSFQVSLPAADSATPEGFVLSPQVISGYYGELSREESALEVSGTVVTGEVTDRMAYDSVAVAFALPEGYFHVRKATIPVVSISYLAVGMMALLLLCVIYWRIRLRNPGQAITSRLLSPGGLLACQLSQALDGTTCDMAALILEWANLGYLSIHVAKQGKVALTRGIAMGSERSRAEQWLYNQIFAGKRRVGMTPGRFARAGARFQAISRRSLRRVYVDKTGGRLSLVQLPCNGLLAVGIGYMSYMLLPDYGGFIVLAVLFGAVGLLYSFAFHRYLADWVALRRFSWKTAALLVVAAVLLASGLLGGAFLVMIVGLAACGFSAIATASGPRRNPRGREIMAETKGCRKFYHRVSWQRLQVLMGRNDRFFQEQLPKAVALSADKALAKRCERLLTPQPEWLTGVRRKTFSAKELQRQIRPVVKALRAAFEA